MNDGGRDQEAELKSNSGDRHSYQSNKRRTETVFHRNSKDQPSSMSEVVIGHGIVLSELKKFFNEQRVTISHVIIISDTNVRQCHPDLMDEEIPNAILSQFSALSCTPKEGHEEAKQNKPIDMPPVTTTESTERRPPNLLQYSILPGEASKTRKVKAEIEDFMLQSKCSRNTVVVGIGGGVVGDLSGFVAATYMRGVPFVLLPTTVMAMADSSIGGKTGVNTPHGKNLIGAFHHPRLIITDIQFLATLSARHVSNGMAEIIKMGFLRKPQIIKILETYGIDIIREPMQLMNVITLAVQEKQSIVAGDAKERGLRAILNFGHTLGHGIEALTSTQLFHGECVSIGMASECEMACYCGITPTVLYSRIIHLLKRFNLPTELDIRVSQRRLLQHIAVDKKSSGKDDETTNGVTVPIVCLASVGRVATREALNKTEYIHYFSERLAVMCLDNAITIGGSASTVLAEGGKLMVDNFPSSKSLCNRALLLAALSGYAMEIDNFLISDDTMALIGCLRKLGYVIELEFTKSEECTLRVTGRKTGYDSASNEIHLDVQNSGTTARFITAASVILLQDGVSARIDGNSYMRKRPIWPLVDALNSIFETEDHAVPIEYLGDVGKLPVRIRRGRMSSTRWCIDSSLSSQYVSAMVMIAPHFEQDITVSLTGESVTSRPFIDMTIQLMKQLGFDGISQAQPRTICWEATKPFAPPKRYRVESDFTAASYPVSWAVIAGKTIESSTLNRRSLQGDAAFLDLPSRFGYRVMRENGCLSIAPTTFISVQINSGKCVKIPYIKAIDVDMNEMTDCFLSMVSIAVFAHGTTYIRGIANQRIKECDRIAQMIIELQKLGVEAWQLDDGIAVTGLVQNKAGYWTVEFDARPTLVDPADDHRIAMAFSLLAASPICSARGVSISIGRRHCVNKTFPGYWPYMGNVLDASTSAYNIDSVGGRSLESVYSEKTYVRDIVLIGFRGVGKSTLARFLAMWFGAERVDIDDDICHNFGMEKCEDIISAFGWGKFRECETSSLLKRLDESGLSSLRVISCGGGIIEEERAREALKLASDAIVLWLQRPLEECIDTVLSRSSTATAEQLKELYYRRKQWYHQCATLSFYCSSAASLQEVEFLFVQFVSRVLCRSLGRRWFQEAAFGPLSGPLKPGLWSKFVCVNLSDVRYKTDPAFWRMICQGSDVVELRVDEFVSLDTEFIQEQIWHMRRMLPSHMSLMFTVRTSGEGGNVALSRDQYVALLHLGIRCGCDLVDIESWLSGTILTSVLATCKRTGCYSVLSKHVLDPLQINDATVREFVLPLCQWRPDYVKFIPVVNSQEDALALSSCSRRLRKYVVDQFNVDLICFGMGDSGKISRVYNECLTPVTHDYLTRAAAPGQLSAYSINQMRRQLCIIDSKQYSLYGKDISSSFSPVLQNSGLNYLLESPNYTIIECESSLEFIEEAKHMYRLGGANVTAPYKHDAIALVESLSYPANSIGAVNTILRQCDNGTVRLRGDNTDWLGIAGPVYQRLAWIGSVNASAISGIVIGAGGASRAAIFALLKLGCRVTVVNRTISKAQRLAEEFNIDYADTPESLVQSEGCNGPQVIVNTLPGDCSLELPMDVFKMSVNTIAMDVSYRPCVTSFLSQAIDNGAIIITGVEMLYCQGVCSFERWLERTAPAGIMLEALYEEYSRLEPQVLQLWRPQSLLSS
eukprot:gb/GECG01015131.1/.p1 GENE.gb/GECG01015131.1/~~gb/GECG01015131.1/.p1  ORF type:complete len:1685 (+),score=152.21 gb/GECG01015131.1/:1-5055(+)